MDQQLIEKDCNHENFFSETILRKFKEDNAHTAGFLRQSLGINKNRVWKPDKVLISQLINLDESFFV